jgi:hypothetical protein
LTSLDGTRAYRSTRAEYDGHCVKVPVPALTATVCDGASCAVAGGRSRAEEGSRAERAAVTARRARVTGTP